MRIAEFRARIICATLLVSALGGCRGGLDGVPGLGGMARISKEVGARLSPSTKRASRSPSAVARLTRGKSPEITPQNFAEVQLALGQSFERDGKLEAAESAYEAAIRNNSQSAKAYHRLALVREKSGRGDEAKILFQKALEHDPDNAEAHCDYAYWCYLRRNWDEAEQHLRQAVQLDDRLQRAHNNLAMVLARSGRPEEALPHFASAGLTVAEAHTNLGFVHMTEHRLPEARQHLEQAVAVDPGSDRAREALASLERVDKLSQVSDSQLENVPFALQGKRPPAESRGETPASATLGRRGDVREDLSRVRLAQFADSSSGISRSTTGARSFAVSDTTETAGDEHGIAGTIYGSTPIEATDLPHAVSSQQTARAGDGIDVGEAPIVFGNRPVVR